MTIWPAYHMTKPNLAESAISAAVPMLMDKIIGPAPVYPNVVEQPLVSIIIPTVDPWQDQLQRCLDTISRYTPLAIEIIIVDNGSGHGIWPFGNLRIERIHNETNLGFAHACNQGIATAKGRHIVLLNDDVEVTDGWLERMLEAMQPYEDVGLVGPMSDNVSGPQNGPAVPGAKPVPIMRLVGHCLLISRRVIDKIGGLDESFGHNFEDDDYCLRAASAGFTAHIATDAFVHHKGSATFKALGIDYSATITAAWQKFAAKWGARGDGPVSGSYQVDVPAWDRERCFIPLPSVSTQPYR